MEQEGQIDSSYSFKLKMGLFIYGWLGFMAYQPLYVI